MTKDERFKSLYQRYYRRIVRFYGSAFHLAEEDAKELAQDTFLRFYQAMGEYRGDAEWAYLEEIARNVAYNKIRAQKTAKRSGTTVDIDDPNTRVPAAPQPPDYAERQEQAVRLDELRRAIEELPDGQRHCLQLSLDDFRYEEIARFLGISVDAVKSRLRDARKVLRARLGADPLPEGEP
jgi:RNA polymerase sigma-70 factor (ECF subfamily)